MTARPTLIALNTVERLLRGDFFHTVSIDAVVDELRGFPADWPAVGLGTTNWYRRNGEIVIEGTAARPAFLWADPGDERRPNRILDLVRERPEPEAELHTPSLADDEREPRMPFAAVAACDPAHAQTLELPPGRDLHESIRRACEERNVGLAAVRLSGELAHADYEAAWLIPLGGAESFDALGKESGRTTGERWQAAGLFAANPTVQHMVSVEGRPVHLHGRSLDSDVGGHVAKATTGDELAVELWPLQDLVMRIRDLDTAWLPVREL